MMSDLVTRPGTSVDATAYSKIESNAVGDQLGIRATAFLWGMASTAIHAHAN